MPLRHHDHEVVEGQVQMQPAIFVVIGRVGDSGLIEWNLVGRSRCCLPDPLIDAGEAVYVLGSASRPVGQKRRRSTDDLQCDRP